MPNLLITQTKSGIGATVSQKETLRSLGFRRTRRSVVQSDTPVTRGMISKVKHLIKFEEVE